MVTGFGPSESANLILIGVLLGRGEELEQEPVWDINRDDPEVGVPPVLTETSLWLPLLVLYKFTGATGENPILV